MANTEPALAAKTIHIRVDGHEIVTIDFDPTRTTTGMLKVSHKGSFDALRELVSMSMLMLAQNVQGRDIHINHDTVKPEG
jgi:hypothetical protein